MKLIIADDEEIIDHSNSNDGFRIFDLPENLAKEDIIEIVSSKNFKVAHYFSKMGILHDSLRSNDYDSIAGRIVTIVGYSVNFVSISGKVIASVNVEEGRKNRFSKNQYIPGMDKIRGYAPDTFFFNPKHTNKLLPVEEFESEDLGNFMFPIMAENSSPTILGYIMLENLSAKNVGFMLPAIDYICSALALTFWSYERNEYKNISRYTALIKQILNGDVNDNAQIKRLTDEYFPIKTYPLQLIVIQGKDIFNEFKQNDNVISEVFPLGVYFSYNTVSAVLIPYDEYSLSGGLLDCLQESLVKYDCTAGISEPIPQIDVDFKNYFQRAHAAAITASMIEIEDRRYMYYKEAALCHLAVNLTEVPHLSGIRKSLVDVNLIRMIELDAKKGSDYFRTLQAYWHFNHDTAKICDYLHLSKSTLFYKLNKIKEYLGQDINDYENIVQMSLGIAILESMGLVHRDVYPDK
ncbi:MAG: helix-turn-helix domain-containing protein [Lachnospiraceae bacterium]|nr:helix-turn-helix domain-containing protein [Lachnospiraceae bacterium]